MAQQCMCPIPDGAPCGRPAILTDPERGILVCEEHRLAEDAETAALPLRFWGHVVLVVGRVLGMPSGAISGSDELGDTSDGP